MSPSPSLQFDWTVFLLQDSKAAADSEKLNKEKEKLQAQVEALKKAAHEDHSRIKQLEKDLKEAQTKSKPAGPSAEDVCSTKTAA